MRLKLLNPIGIGHAAGADHAGHDQPSACRCFGADLQTIDDIERQLVVYRADLSREFEFRLSEVDNVLQQFENRGMQFFDETLRIGRIPDLLNKARIQREFEREVVADVPQQIERQVTTSSTGWWRASCASGRRSATTSIGAPEPTKVGFVGGDASGFQYDRQKLIDTVGRAANAPSNATTASARLRRWPRAFERQSPERRWRRRALSASAPGHGARHHDRR